MSSLPERVRLLETDLRADPPQHYVYHDLPFAVFCYPPDEEWNMRLEIERLKTRLEKDTARTVVSVSLAELVWQAIEESEGLEAVARLEQRSGFDAAQRQIQDYLSLAEWRPLPDLLAKRLEGLTAEHHLVFLTRAGALSPNIYRASKLLDEMKGRTAVPCVLFLPAATEGRASLRFMGISENEGRGSYHTRVYM